MAGGELRVDTGALQAMSGRWEALADGLQPSDPAESAGSCPSAAAVTEGDAAIATAAGTLSARVSAGAAEVAGAATRHGRTEADSAHVLGTLAALMDNAR